MNNNFIAKLRICAKNMSKCLTATKRERKSVGQSHRGISNLLDSRICKDARVLNFNDNPIQDLKDIGCFKYLTILCLVNTRISDMKQINNLPSLKKLFLGYNFISRLEGLDKCHELYELFVGSQRIKSSFSFCPTTMKFLTKMNLLDVSRNKVVDISPLADLTELESLDVSFNELASPSRTFTALKAMKRLAVLDCSGNPMVSRRRFREELLSHVPELRIYNRKEINESEINYYKKIVFTDENRRNKIQIEHNMNSAEHLSELSGNSGPQGPLETCQAISSSCNDQELKDSRDYQQYHDWRKLAVTVRPEQAAVDECLRMIAESLPTGFRSAVSSSEYNRHISQTNLNSTFE